MKCFKKITFLLGMVTVLALSGCSSFVDSEQEETVSPKASRMAFVIELPASGNQRAAYYEQSDATSYSVELSKGSATVTKKSNLAPGSKVTLSVEEEGTYSIKVLAYKGTTVIAQGETESEIKFSDGEVKVVVRLTPNKKSIDIDVEIVWDTPNAQNPSGYIGTKAPSEAKAVGDIVFSDGSATPYSEDLSLTDEQKSKAIAVIFYVGTECSNDSKSRTLGVGLYHGVSLCRWCTESADASEKNITSIQCEVSGNAGDLTFTGDKDGSDNFEQIASFEGVNDTELEENYPAFYYAKNYKALYKSHVFGTSYESGWYLPSVCELFQIWKVKETVDAASGLCGGSQFENSRYWSSSQCASYYNSGYELDFYRGDWFRCGKNVHQFGCAIHEF